MPRKRFGVSIDAAVAEALDVLAQKLGVDRSRLVEDAIRQYLEDHSHLLVPHTCRGVIIAVCPEPSDAVTISEDYRRIVATLVHAHYDRGCIEVLLVEGESSEIASLYSKLVRTGCSTRLIPLPGKTPHKPSQQG